jgi:hypothetical protein
MGRDRQRAFLLSSVHFRWNEQAMPMHVFRNVCVVHNLYSDRLALAHPQQGTGDLIAVADGADDNLRRQFDQHWRDLQVEVRRASGGPRFRRHRHRVL